MHLFREGTILLVGMVQIIHGRRFPLSRWSGRCTQRVCRLCGAVENTEASEIGQVRFMLHK
jgi:hypothetical protein